jgi:hypothetical protein
MVLQKIEYFNLYFAEADVNKSMLNILRIADFGEQFCNGIIK